MTITMRDNTVVYNDDSLTIVCTGKDGYIHRYGELIDDLKVLGREAFSDGDEFEEFEFKVYIK